MTTVFIDGEQVYLRPLERKDAEQLVPWVNDYEVTRNLAIYRPISVEAELDVIDRLSKSETDVAVGIAEKGTDELVGVTGLHQIDFRNRHAAFGIFIGEKTKWGLGYGTEATRLITMFGFETLNLNRVWLHVRATNAAGIRAYEKVGYRREGLLRQHWYCEGRYDDIVTMAILREDWKSAR